MRDIFYFTDIHGCRPLFDAIMNYCHEQDDEAMIIFGGDACDRGLRGYQIMKELLDNPQVVYLKGNHEDMFVKAAREIKEGCDLSQLSKADIASFLYSTMVYDYYENIRLSVYNHGMQTLMDWINDGMPMDFVDKIDKLPLTFSTDTCDFCHAGATPQVFEEIAQNEYDGVIPDEYFRQVILWDRNKIEAIWRENKVCIFGHTPTIALEKITSINIDDELDPQPVRLAEGTKIDMDTGAAFRGVAWVLNTLTMEAQGFEDIDVTCKENRKHDVKKIYSIRV